MNQEPRTCLCWILPLAMILAAGCAPAYHSYSGCSVNCKYCAPPPLPYAHYDGCTCHSCAVSKYLSAVPHPELEPAPMPETIRPTPSQQPPAEPGA